LYAPTRDAYRKHDFVFTHLVRSALLRFGVSRHKKSNGREDYEIPREHKICSPRFVARQNEQVQSM
jgi:hypothetical protein